MYAGMDRSWRSGERCGEGRGQEDWIIPTSQRSRSSPPPDAGLALRSYGREHGITPASGWRGRRVFRAGIIRPRFHANHFSFGQFGCKGAQGGHLIRSQSRLQGGAQATLAQPTRPASAIAAEICAAPGKLAGGIHLHTVLGRADDPDELALCVRLPADDTGSLWRRSLPARLGLGHAPLRGSPAVRLNGVYVVGPAGAARFALLAAHNAAQRLIVD